MNLLFRGLWARLAQVVLFNTLIALAITSGSPHSFWMNMAYSQSIGLTIWAWVDVVSGWLFPQRAKNHRFMLWWAPLGIVMGYVVGNVLGDVLTGNSLLHVWRNQPKIALAFLIVTFTAGCIGTYFFISQEELQQRRQEQADLRTQAANAHLTLLQSQLEPHMLFNTLANLRALINTDPQRATHMLDRLNDYLRSTLSASRSTEHALSAEFDRLRDYLELMAIRMGPRMTYTLDLPANLAALHVPPLILQSLVENAIVHGLEPHVAGGTVHVSAQQQGDYLVLQVADSGVGMDAQPGHEGFGIAQVRERIATRYGHLATINFIAARAVNTWTTSRNDHEDDVSGTTAELRIPLAAIRAPQAAAAA